MKYLLLYLLLVFNTFASVWEYRMQVDPMTDIKSLYLSKASERPTPFQSRLVVSLVQGNMLIRIHFPQEIKQDGSLLIRWDKEKAYKVPVHHQSKKSVDIAILDRISPFRKKSMIDRLNSHHTFLIQYRNKKAEKIVVKFVVDGFAKPFNTYALNLYQAFIIKSKNERNFGHQVHTGKYAFARNGCGGCHSTQRNKRLRGPSLYKIKNRLNEDQIRQSITNPNAVITKGYSAGIMPALIMSNHELNEIVEYILEL